MTAHCLDYRLMAGLKVNKTISKHSHASFRHLVANTVTGVVKNKRQSL